MKGRRPSATPFLPPFLALLAILPHRSGSAPALLPSLPSSDHCADHSNCTSCAASTGCHWCGRGSGCHALLSVYGCGIGVDCAKENCVRTEPEHIGYADVDGKSILAVATAFGALACCLLSCLSVCEALVEPELDALRAAGERDATRAAGREGLLDGSASESATRPSARRLPPPAAHRCPPIAPPERCVRASRRLCSAAQRQSRPIYRACHVCGLCLLAVLGVGLVPAVVYFPHVPEYTVCNKAVDWSSIFRGLANMTVRGDVDVLLSIANRNHFDLEVTRFDADFFYEGEKVGVKRSIEPWSVPAGTVVDLWVPMDMSPGYRTATGMLRRYEDNRLVLDCKVSLRGKVESPWFAQAIGYTMKPFEIDVGAEYDQALCRCP
jgi:hypothetical protein